MRLNNWENLAIALVLAGQGVIIVYLMWYISVLVEQLHVLSGQ